MTTTDLQVRIIMKELSKHGNQERAAVKTGVCRQTAAKYIQAGKLSSELKRTHEWQTREDPFAEVWPEIEARLRQAPRVAPFRSRALPPGEVLADQARATRSVRPRWDLPGSATFASP